MSIDECNSLTITDWSGTGPGTGTKTFPDGFAVHQVALFTVVTDFPMDGKVGTSDVATSWYIRFSAFNH